MSTRAQLSETLNRLLPGEQWKRVREGILAGAGYAGTRTQGLRQEIADANRLKTGRLIKGAIDFTTDTSATLSGYVWVIDFQIFQPAVAATITVTAPHPTVERTDLFTGDDAGVIRYYAGTVDALGNSFFPAIPNDEVILEVVTRNPDSSNTVDPGTPSVTDWISKSATALQQMAGPLAISPLAGVIQDIIGTDPNGMLRKVPASRAGVYTTREGDGGFTSGWSRMLRITIDPALQINYVITFQVLGVTPTYEKGDMWVIFRIDGSGDIITNSLQLFGDFTPARYKLIKVDSTHYELYLSHDEIDSLYSFRPIMLFGNDWRYEFYQQEVIVENLPAGDDYDFTLFGGGGISDAPSDAKVYGRKDAGWVDSKPVNQPAYANQAAMLADQANQLAGFLYQDDTSTWAKLATSTGVIGDYIKVGDIAPGGGGADTNAVHYNAADGKNATEKRQARDNIGSTAGIPQIIATTGTINDLAKTSNCLIFTGAGGLILNGIVAGLDGEEICLFNASNSTLTLNANNVGSSANNRFQNAQIIPVLSWLIVKYRTTTNKWIIEGSGNFVSINIEDTKIAKFNISALGTNGGTAPLNINETGGTINLPILRLLSNSSLVYGFFLNLFQSLATSNQFRSLATAGSTGILYIDDTGSNVNATLFTIRNSGGTLIQAYGNGGIVHNRSVSGTYSIRRDEQRLYYLGAVTTSGAINNQALTAGIFNYRFTAATSITGFANGEIGRTIDIDNATGAILTLEHENAGSIAANRIKLIGAAALAIPIDGKVTLKYCTGSRWELVSKNF